MKNIRRLLKVWGKMTTFAMQTALANKLSVILFVSAKLIRFAIFFFTISLIIDRTSGVAGFSRDQVLLVFFCFTLIDAISQMLFREVYRFRPRIISGDFDLDLLKPLPSLFRPLLGGADPLDLITLIPFSIGFVYFLLHSTSISNAWSSYVLFVLLILNAVLISASFHILVLALGILSTEVDHVIMVYRDIWSMGRFPTTIYSGGVHLLLQYIIPVAVMVTAPIEVLSGRLQPEKSMLFFCVGLAFFVCSLGVWRQALKRYTSAGS